MDGSTSVHGQRRYVGKEYAFSHVNTETTSGRLPRALPQISGETNYVDSREHETDWSDAKLRT